MRSDNTMNADKPAVIEAADRPYVLTPAVRETIIDSLARGNFIATTCRLGGIAPSTFYRWRKRVAEGDPVAERFADFYRHVNMVLAQFEVRAVAAVTEGDP